MLSRSKTPRTLKKPCTRPKKRSRMRITLARNHPKLWEAPTSTTKVRLVQISRVTIPVVEEVLKQDHVVMGNPRLEVTMAPSPRIPRSIEIEILQAIQAFITTEYHYRQCPRADLLVETEETTALVLRISVVVSRSAITGVVQEDLGIKAFLTVWTIGVHHCSLRGTRGTNVLTIPVLHMAVLRPILEVRRILIILMLSTGDNQVLAIRIVLTTATEDSRIKDALHRILTNHPSMDKRYPVKRAKNKSIVHTKVTLVGSPGQCLPLSTEASGVGPQMKNPSPTKGAKDKTLLKIRAMLTPPSRDYLRVMVLRKHRRMMIHGANFNRWPVSTRTPFALASRKRRKPKRLETQPQRKIKMREEMVALAPTILH